MIEYLGIGAQKSGTSWVYACLYEHPEICSPVKELHFFSRDRYQKGIEWYENHFNSCQSGTKKGEFSTSYLYSKEAPKRMYEYNPNLKLIAILRNPIDRAYSQYRNAIKAGEIEKSKSFSAYADEFESCLAQGLYAEQLERYLKYFKKENLLILQYEDCRSDPQAFIKSIYLFLGIDESFVPSMLHIEVNIARTPKVVLVDRIMHALAESLRTVGLDRLVWHIKKSGVTDAIRSINTEKTSEEKQIDSTELQAYFRNDVEELSRLTGRNYSKEWSI